MSNCTKALNTKGDTQKASPQIRNLVQSSLITTAEADEIHKTKTKQR